MGSYRPVFRQRQALELCAGSGGRGAVLLLEILIDNTNARLKWQRMFKTTWAMTMIIGVINIFVLQVLKGV